MEKGDPKAADVDQCFGRYQALAQRMQVSTSHTARISAAEHKLRTTAPPAIDELLSWIRGRQYKLTNQPIREQARKTNRISAATGTVIREYWSNTASLNRQMAALHAAYDAAEELKLSVLEPEVLQRRLDSLKADLPDEEFLMIGAA